MPFSPADRRVAAELAKEARQFARLVGQIAKDDDAPPHPEVKVVLQAFQQINKHLSAGTGPAVVSLRRKVSVGREFKKIGAALTTRSKR